MLGAIILTAVLLVFGLALRARFRILSLARIPASLIAGGIGLFVWQVALWGASNQRIGGAGSTWRRFVDWFESDSIAHLQTWPGWLIAIVFAGMLLSKSSGADTPDPKEPAGEGTGQRSNRGGFAPVAREALMVWIIVLGQTVVGLLMVWWWLGASYDLPASAGMLIETGFAGGHGTAAAMGTVLSHPAIGLDAGLDLGVLMATSGLVYGLVSGIVWIEVGVRCGWVAGTRSQGRSAGANADAGSPEETLPDANGSAKQKGRSHEGTTLPQADAIDPLLMQVVWLILAFSIGVGLQWGVDSLALLIDQSGWLTMGGNGAGQSVETALRDRLQIAGIVGSFPLFIYTLFGGAIVRWCVLKTVGERWIDHETINRLVGTSMDLLVVAAIVTLNLAVVAALWIPMTALFLTGAAWSTFCLMVLSRRILPESHWFELGLINFGMSTGTTATGFVLLRVIDPDLKTRAAEHYALAAPLSAPFIGGGMITVALPLLVLQRVPIALSALAMTVVLALLIAWGVSWKRKCGE